MIKIDNIYIEGLVTPLVTDKTPRIGFSLSSDTNDCELDYALIKVGDWMISTKDQINNIYPGPLTPHTNYEVNIEAFDNSGQSTRSSASFITGKLSTPWKGKWITDRTYSFPKKTSPKPMVFKKDFISSKDIAKAWINSTALGIYELNLNGTKVGDDYFAPGFTDYDYHIQYQTYDVTSHLKKENQLIVHVGGGWAVGLFTYNRVSHIYADKQSLLLELHIEYTDGTRELICSDESWFVSTEGPYQMAEWYDGETYNANISYDQMPWKSVSITNPRKKPKLMAAYGQAVRIQQVLNPISIEQAPSGEFIYDFGQNFAGVISCEIEGKKNQTIVFRHAEVLHKGELFVKSLRTAKATATYIATEGIQEYSPKLTYMGFRYVGVSGIDPSKIKLSALVLHTDFETVGTFECSNTLVNQLHHNIVWGGKSNFLDIPTDCPQRDERQGWTGDLSVFATTACYNFDLSSFIDKWLLDMRSEQGVGGGIPMVVPIGGDKWPILATSAWGDSCILVPWAEYMARGNLDLLKKQYPTIKRFLKAAKRWSSFLSFSDQQRHIWRFPFHFGDWCAPNEDVKQWLKKGKWVATAYFANSCQIASQIAELLGYNEDSNYYRSLRQKIINAYIHVFTDGKGKLKKEFQTAYVLPLHFDMTDGPEKQAMADNLARLVKDADNHLTTGFTGTPYLLFALSDNGHVDVAYDLLLQESCPSWLYEVKAGGTTIWERWDSLRPDGSVNITDLSGKKSDEESNGGMVSFNHYANGAVGDWLYKRLLGIEPTSGGYKTFKIQPILGGDIKNASGSVQTPYGIASLAWSINDNQDFTLDFHVPVSTECTVILPDMTRKTYKSGHHLATCKLL